MLSGVVVSLARGDDLGQWHDERHLPYFTASVAK